MTLYLPSRFASNIVAIMNIAIINIVATITDAPNNYLDMLKKLQKQVHRTVGSTFVTSLESLVHLQNMASLSIFYQYYLGRCSSELDDLFLLP